MLYFVYLLTIPSIIMLLVTLLLMLPVILFYLKFYSNLNLNEVRGVIVISLNLPSIILRKGKKIQVSLGIPVVLQGIIGGMAYKPSLQSKNYKIIISPFMSDFVLWHEIGHIRLRHLERGVGGIIMDEKIEYEADLFAVRRVGRFKGIMVLVSLFILHAPLAPPIMGKILIKRIKILYRAKDVPWFK